MIVLYLGCGQMWPTDWSGWKRFTDFLNRGSIIPKLAFRFFGFGEAYWMTAGGADVFSRWCLDSLYLGVAFAKMPGGFLLFVSDWWSNCC